MRNHWWKPKVRNNDPKHKSYYWIWHYVNETEVITFRWLSSGNSYRTIYITIRMHKEKVNEFNLQL